MHPGEVVRVRTHGGKDPQVKSASVHHHQPGLSSHQPERQQTQRCNNLLPFCLLRIASVQPFLFMFYKDCSFSPLILLFMFIDGLLTVGMGCRQRLPVKNAAKSKLQPLRWSSAPVYWTGGSTLEGLVLMSHRGLLLESLLFPP